MDLTLMAAESMSGVIPFLAHFLSGAVLLAVFAAIYMFITPYNEIALIRAGKTAPAVAVAGALLGFTLPIYAAIAHSINLLDMLLWALVSGVLQILVFEGFRLMYRDLVRAIEDDRTGAAIFLSALSICTGLLNAASMTW